VEKEPVRQTAKKRVWSRGQREGRDTSRVRWGGRKRERQAWERQSEKKVGGREGWGQRQREMRLNLHREVPGCHSRGATTGLGLPLVNQR
jgi:hypothetical protein